MTEIKIEDGIPIPNGLSGWPFPGLKQPGQSFFVPAAKIGAATARVVKFKSDLPVEDVRAFTCRTVVENGVKGVRVWRTA